VINLPKAGNTMDAMEEHVNRALIELYFAIAEFESAPFATERAVDEPQRLAIAKALQAARNALETSAQLAQPGPHDESPAQAC
jgi:hypothetical protein